MFDVADKAHAMSEGAEEPCASSLSVRCHGEDRTKGTASISTCCPYNAVKRREYAKILHTNVEVIPILLRWKLSTLLYLAVPSVVGSVLVDFGSTHCVAGM